MVSLTVDRTVVTGFVVDLVVVGVVVITADVTGPPVLWYALADKTKKGKTFISLISLLNLSLELSLIWFLYKLSVQMQLLVNIMSSWFSSNVLEGLSNHKV